MKIAPRNCVADES